MATSALAHALRLDQNWVFKKTVVFLSDSYMYRTKIFFVKI